MLSKEIITVLQLHTYCLLIKQQNISVCGSSLTEAQALISSTMVTHKTTLTDLSSVKKHINTVQFNIYSLYQFVYELFSMNIH